MGRHRLRSPSERLLVFLVESGFVYCLFWLTQLVLFFPPSRASGSIWAWEVLAPLGNQISGLYPTIIIVVVKLQHSLHDTYNPQTLDTLTNADDYENTNNHESGANTGDLVSLKFRNVEGEAYTTSLATSHLNSFSTLERTPNTIPAIVSQARRRGRATPSGVK
jgi:hypothetical protein